MPNYDPLTQGTQPCVLVVDDMPQSLHFVTAALEEAGMTVLIARDGFAALDLLKKVVPNIIIMDGLMPGLDGFEVTRRLRADPTFTHVPVIFMTGLTETEHVIQGLQSGGVDYIRKPVDVNELVARVRVHLQNARTGQAVTQALDFGHRPTIGVDNQGVLLWHTPQSALVLTSAFPGWALNKPLPEPLLSVMTALLAQRSLMLRRTIDITEGVIECVLMGTMNDGTNAVSLLLKRPGDEERLLETTLGLTVREAQVLLWISKGKSNRDVSAILNISPRTVNKHLEQIFVKLGIENRTSAAAIAMATMNK
ncbi:MAG: DNA-binding response regulator [Acetobacter orientalis]|uniref:DNA-binding response regulator n=1 Tax=Acetobacter orientalis TaxID=146474 RepID=A0A2Z5ZL51_9PROT|nr:DNA-binding response regulator [Acetobacter orientalis]BBC81143.1 DNA-binding response regulator [Acetobacter orientalis]GAN66498.1 two component transcriptional regulator LuxR [Acetobacter orientalis]GBR20984.1 two component response regulator [Acetobacter orientalis NRIC 0481]GEL61878.1 DNA-binding response regulator [Acetobacter orientalis]